MCEVYCLCQICKLYSSLLVHLGVFVFLRYYFDRFHMFSLSFISLGFGVGEPTV